MSEWVFVRYPLTAVGCRGYFAIGVYLSPIATACGEYNYPAPPAQVCRLGLPFKQSSFIPHSQRFTLPFSSGSIVSQLTTLPICYTPHWVSPPDKSIGDRVICTSLRNTFSYCRATGRIPNCPRAALAYAAALPGAQYILDDLQHDDRTVCAGVNIHIEPDPVRGRAGEVEAQGRAVAVFPPYRAIYADRHKRIPIKAKDNLHTAF